jgi:signal transduction histidine kinase
MASFNVADEVRSACETIAPTLATNGNCLTLDIDPNLSIIHSDSFKFGQCVLNLLSNACKFTKDGTIKVKLWQGIGTRQDQVFVSVTDSGLGMTPDQVKGLFQPFTQADASITRKFGGTGLGLSLSRSLAQLMGGDISVTSALGKGSCFQLSITPEWIDACSVEMSQADRPLIVGRAA